MKSVSFARGLSGLVFALIFAYPAVAQTSIPGGWKAHDMRRPQPPRVEPAPQDLPVPPPEEAVVLFGGEDLSAWVGGSGGSADWTVHGDYFEVRPGAGAIRTREEFGDVQLHVEWASPPTPEHEGQNRGNSGVFLMQDFEVQVLDSWNNQTYADGRAAAIYGQYPPLFDVTRPPGEWQSYDIYFRRPRFEDGELAEPARMTVVHNGILVQDNVELIGTTSWLRYGEYVEKPEKLPIVLQDHGSPVRFRNIWVLPLPQRPTVGTVYEEYAGAYDRVGQQGVFRIIREGDKLYGNFSGRPLRLLPAGADEFVLEETHGRVTFERNAQGVPARMTFHLGGDEMEAVRQ